VCTLSRVGDVEHHQHAMTAPVSAFLLNLQHTIISIFKRVCARGCIPKLKEASVAHVFGESDPATSFLSIRLHGCFEKFYKLFDRPTGCGRTHSIH
jgi:hypothetical protein